MEADWDWQRDNNIRVKKEGMNYELWRIWWTICTTGTKGKA